MAVQLLSQQLDKVLECLGPGGRLAQSVEHAYGLEEAASLLVRAATADQLPAPTGAESAQLAR